MRKVVNVTRSGRDARARDIPFWVTAGACVLLTCAVLAALAILHAWSVNQESGSQSMAALRTAVAVEQEGVLDSVTTRVALQADANAALGVAVHHTYGRRLPGGRIHRAGRYSRRRPAISQRHQRAGRRDSIHAPQRPA